MPPSDSTISEAVVCDFIKPCESIQIDRIDLSGLFLVVFEQIRIFLIPCQVGVVEESFSADCR
jgi:hypothetical protein